MRDKSDLIVVAALVVAGLAVSLFHFPGGWLGMSLIFLSLTAAPGYLLIRCLRIPKLDSLEIYPISLAIGISIYMLLGLALTALNAPVDRAAPIVCVISIILLGLNFKANSLSLNEPARVEEKGLRISSIIYVIIITIISIRLGSFRGWGEDWDYYTYITMVRRLAERGIAGNYPVAYFGEKPDPVHSYNSWALLWATVSRGASIDPITLYVKSAFLTVPAALLAFYCLAKSFFNRLAAHVALILYATYHLFGMGLILLGSSTFFNDDPAWLLLFPISVSMFNKFTDCGIKGVALVSILVLAGAFVMHPLWGALTLMAHGMMAAVNLFPRAKPKRWVNLSAGTGAAILVVPVIYSVMVLMGVESQIMKNITLAKALAISLIPPAILSAPWLLSSLSAALKDAAFRRSLYLFMLCAIVVVPFIILRYSEAGGARPEIHMETSPYKIFITSRLFILSPFNFSYTAPDMTLYPYCLLGILALPWLISRYFHGERAAGITAAGIIIIPFIAFHPSLAFLFSKATHVAYLRRALRLGAMFAACGGGAFVASLLAKRPRVILPGVAVCVFALAITSALYPYSPHYFQQALTKSTFVFIDPPSEGLFWSADYEAYKQDNPKWDKERFSELISDVPEGQTIFSDRFTSYRLTAYRDVYVVCRLKPSTGASDQFSREIDQAKYFDPVSDDRTRCSILKKYSARWVLLNTDPDYHIREYYMGDPWLAEKMTGDSGMFKLKSRVGDWTLFEATPQCW